MDGRFKSCLVDSEAYLLTCMRYIESNPVVEVDFGKVDMPPHSAPTGGCHHQNWIFLIIQLAKRAACAGLIRLSNLARLGHKD